MFRKILLAAAGLILIALAGLAVYVASRQHLTFDLPFPPITASSDSVTIARGRYLVRDVVDCTGCHGDPAQRAAIMAGQEVPLRLGHPAGHLLRVQHHTGQRDGHRPHPGRSHRARPAQRRRI